MSINQPDPHKDPWVNLPFRYATSTLQTLQADGYVVDRAWMDPSSPRDCTFVLSDSQALTWDEDFGWITGGFVSGRQGERTVLASPRQLIGKILPAPAEVLEALRTGKAAGLVRLRDYGARDGLDEKLRQYAP